MGLSSDSFALTLLGRDGGMKLESETAVGMEEVYALIDTMPMRRREMLGYYNAPCSIGQMPLAREIILHTRGQCG